MWKRLNKWCDDHEEGKNPLEDHANHLIGKVSEEPTMPEKLKNAEEILSSSYVDGLLIGGASLNPEDFSNIYNLS